MQSIQDCETVVNNLNATHYPRESDRQLRVTYVSDMIDTAKAKRRRFPPSPTITSKHMAYLTSIYTTPTSHHQSSSASNLTRSGTDNDSSRASAVVIAAAESSTQIETTERLKRSEEIKRSMTTTASKYYSPEETVVEIVRLLGNPAKSSWGKDDLGLSLSDPAAYHIPVQATMYGSGTIPTVYAEDFYFAMVVMSNERIERKSTDAQIRDRLKSVRDAAILARQSFLNELRCSPDVVPWDALDDRCLRYMVYIFLMSQNFNCSSIPGMSSLQMLKWTTDPKVACLVLPHPRDMDISTAMPFGLRSRQDLKDIEIFMHGGEYDRLQAIQQLRTTIQSLPGPIDVGYTSDRKLHSADVKVNERLYWDHPDNDEEQKRNRAAVFCKRSELEKIFTRLTVNCAATLPSFVTEVTKGNNGKGFKVACRPDRALEEEDYFVFFKVCQAEQLYTSLRIFHSFARSESAQLFPWKLIVSRDLYLDIPALDSIIRNSAPVSAWFPNLGITNAVVIPDYFGFRFFSQQKKVRDLFDDKCWPVNVFKRFMKSPEVLEKERIKRRDADIAKKLADKARDEERLGGKYLRVNRSRSRDRDRDSERYRDRDRDRYRDRSRSRSRFRNGDRGRGCSRDRDRGYSHTGAVGAIGGYYAGN